MKGIIFLADGMADEPVAELGNRTPLEAADTPAMDSIARRGASGTFLTLPEGLPTSSDVANMSVLGFAPERNYPGRGPIEAASQRIELADDDVAWRCNLVKVTPDGVLEDYSAGHIPNEVSSELMSALQREFGSDKVTFYPGVSYRNLLVLHGREFSDKVAYHKPDSSQGVAVSELGLRALEPAARHTVDFLEDLGRRASAFLKSHPLAVAGTSQATDIWPWSPGHKPAIGTFEQRYGRTGAIISAVDVIKGLGRCTGMDVVEVAGATGFVDTNYEGKARAAIEAIKTHDLVYIHVEAIDECSHMGDLKLKMRAIRDFDSRIVAPVLKAFEGVPGMRFAILPDHPVPLHLRQHTTTPVPVAVCGDGIESDGVMEYGERAALQGRLGAMRGDAVVRLVLGL